MSALSGAVIGIRAVCGACWMTSYKMEVDGCYSTIDIEAAQWFWSWCIMSWRRMVRARKGGKEGGM